MKNKYTPLVSVMMCCFNGKEFIHDSIPSLLGQTYSNWELVFWDNQSTDNSKDELLKYDDNRIKYYRSEAHTNLGGSRKGAYSKIRGELIAILDTDDIWAPDKLERQVKHFEDSNVGISTSNSIFFSSKNEKLAYKKAIKDGYVYYDLISNYHVSLDTVILRKSHIENLSHGFTDKFNYICDMDLIIRLSEYSKLKYEHLPLSKWRYHERSLTFLDSLQFIEEKKSLLLQLKDENSLKDSRLTNALLKFEKKIILSEVIYIILNRKIKSRIDYYIEKYKILDLKSNLILLLSILFPFSKTIIAKMKSAYGMVI